MALGRKCCEWRTHAVSCAAAQDELALVVPAGHGLAARGAVDVAELYALALVSLNRGSTVQAAQEATLRAHGILWRHLNVTMVRRGRPRRGAPPRRRG